MNFIYIVEKTEIHNETWPIAAFSNSYKADQYAQEMEAKEDNKERVFYTYRCLSVDPKEID